MTTTSPAASAPARDTAGRALVRLICLLASVAFLAVGAIFAGLMLVTSTVSDLQVHFMEGALVVGVFALVLFCLALPPARPSRWVAVLGTLTGIVGVLLVVLGIANPQAAGAVNQALLRGLRLLCVDVALASALVRVVWSFVPGPRLAAQRANQAAALLIGLLTLLVAVAIVLSTALPPALGALIALVAVAAAVAFVLAPILAGATLGPSVVLAPGAEPRRRSPGRPRRAPADGPARVAVPISPSALPPRDGIRPPSLAPERVLEPEGAQSQDAAAEHPAGAHASVATAEEHDVIESRAGGSAHGADTVGTDPTDLDTASDDSDATAPDGSDEHEQETVELGRRARREALEHAAEELAGADDAPVEPVRAETAPIDRPTPPPSLSRFVIRAADAEVVPRAAATPQSPVTSSTPVTPPVARPVQPVVPTTPTEPPTRAVPFVPAGGVPSRSPEDYIVRTGTAAEEAARRAERDAEAAERLASAAARSTPGSRPPRSGSSRILTLRLTEGQATWLEFVAAGRGADRNAVVAEAIDGTIERYRNAESADGAGDAAPEA